MIRALILMSFILCDGLFLATALAQSSSFGPGKGPAPGTGKSKYTYPQPPKPTPYNPNSIRPAYQVPENAEKSVWRLTAKVDGRDPDKPTNEVPVYSFQGDRKRVQVGFAPAGTEIILEEMRPVGKAHYYKFAWTGGSNREGLGPSPEYWVSGSNIEYAGKK